MARFRFQLDPLLELRRRAEREQQVVVAAIESECRAIEERIRSCQDGIEQSRIDLRGRLGVDGHAQVNAREAAWQTHSMHRMRAEADGLVIKLAGIMQRLTREREVLVELARERRSIEKLRERREQAWRCELARKERVELDDLASIRAAAFNSGGLR